MSYEVGQIRSLHIQVNGNFRDLKRVCSAINNIVNSTAYEIKAVKTKPIILLSFEN